MPLWRVAAINPAARAFLFFDQQAESRSYLLYRNIWLGQVFFRVGFDEEGFQAIVHSGNDSWEDVEESVSIRCQSASLKELVVKLQNSFVWPGSVAASGKNCDGQCWDCHHGLCQGNLATTVIIEE